MNRRNFLATISGAMAYAGLRMDAPKAPEIAPYIPNPRASKLVAYEYVNVAKIGQPLNIIKTK